MDYIVEEKQTPTKIGERLLLSKIITDVGLVLMP